MKILFLLTYYTPHWTGLTQYARRLAEGLAKNNYEVTVLTTKYIPHLQNIEIIRGVKVLRKPILFRLSRGVISLVLIFSMWIEIYKHDAIFIYLPFSEVFIAALIAKLLNKKIYLVHNGDLVLPKGFLNRIIENFYYISTSAAIKLSRTIIIQTEDYAKNSQLLSQFKNKWKEILPLYENLQEDQSIAKKLKLKINPHKKIVGFAGRFVEEKGFDILLKAAPLVLKYIPDVQFVFAGEANIGYEDFFSKNKTLIQKNKKNIVLLGRLREHEITSFYKLCDVFVISSRTDCFPSAEVEALLCSTPVVVTDIPGARWPVQQTRMGVVVNKENDFALAQGIIDVLQNKNSYKNKISKVHTLFNYQKTLDKYIQLIKHT